MDAFEGASVRGVIDLIELRMAMPGQRIELAEAAGVMIKAMDAYRWTDPDLHDLCDHGCAELIHGDFEASCPSPSEYRRVLQALRNALEGHPFEHQWE